MRVIKFRCWNNSTNKWVYPVIDISNPFSYAGCEFSQFTGKQDKNGKEIWEGDIIEFDRQEWGGDDNIHVVTWDERDGAFCYGGGVGHGDMNWRKVIGNIYENPELLTNA